MKADKKTDRMFDTLTEEQQGYVIDLIEISQALYGRIYDYLTEKGLGGQMTTIGEVVDLAEEFYAKHDKGVDWESANRDWGDVVGEWCADKEPMYPVSRLEPAHAGCHPDEAAGKIGQHHLS